MATVKRTTAGSDILIFDGDCAFCTSAVHWLAAHLPKAPTMVAYQQTNLEQYGLTERDCAERIWLISGDRQFGGYLALARMMQRQPGLGTRYLGHLSDTAPFSWASALLYSAVAKNRHRLPGGTPACAMKPLS